MTPDARNDIVAELIAAIDRASNGRVVVEELDKEVRLIEDLGLESLDLLQLKYEIEQAWDVTIENEQLASLETAGDAIALIERCTSGN